jgi:hypothetical protein
MTGGLKEPYTFHNLKAASREEVIGEINSQLASGALGAPTGGLDKPHYLFRAQLLMQELSRRTQNRQACIMILCTIAVTFMTCVLVWLTERIVSGAQQ